MSKSNTTTKPVTVVSQIVAIMEKMKDSPMAATVEKLATTVMAKNGKPIGAARARAYYRDTHVTLPTMIRPLVPQFSARIVRCPSSIRKAKR